MISVQIGRIVPPILWKLGVADIRSHVANLASERAGNAFDGQVPKEFFVSAEDLSGTSDRKDVLIAAVHWPLTLKSSW